MTERRAGAGVVAALVARGFLVACVVLGSASLAPGQTFSPLQQPRTETQPLSRAPEPLHIRSAKSGTAFFVDGSGHMLTARHAAEGCVRVVVAKEGRTVLAQVVALSSRVDLALLRTPKTLGLAAVFPRSVSVAATDMVFAAAYDTLPRMTVGGGTLANAIVAPGSADGSLSLESNLTFGASGAPVLDVRGLVQGVVSRRNAVNRVVAVGAADAKVFLGANGIRVEEDDRPQIAGAGSRANRAASISARVTCLQN
jgi:S1-C subfamily serine protease